MIIDVVGVCWGATIPILVLWVTSWTSLIWVSRRPTWRLQRPRPQRCFCEVKRRWWMYHGFIRVLTPVNSVSYLSRSGRFWKIGKFTKYLIYYLYLSVFAICNWKTIQCCVIRMFDFFKKMNFPSLDQSNCLLGHPAILPSCPTCQASRRQVASLLASALERLVHHAFHAWHTAKAGGWAV